MSKTERKKETIEFCTALGNHIRALRKGRGEIAYKANLDAQNLRKYELGKQEMRVSMLKRIVDAFEISTSELLSFDKSKK